MSSFQTAISGLQAASTDLQVLGNNISNANTVGYKESNAEFADAYAAAIAGNAPTNGQIGIGTHVATVAQQFSQGNIQSTSNPLDVAINGNGFFQFNVNGSTMYGRNGQFQLDSNGYVIDSNGGKLIGIPAVSGTLTGGSGPLQITEGMLQPQATSGLVMDLNLNAATTPVASGTAVVPSDPTTYNYSTSTTVYDSLGAAHLMTTYYQLSSGSGTTWHVYYSVDGTTGTSGMTSGSLGSLPFTSTGAVSGTVSLNTGTLNWADAANPSTIQVNFAGSTNYSTASSVNSVSDNGYAAGSLSNLSISPDGNIFGQYSNGQSSLLGQITLTNFAAPQFLQRAGNNYFIETFQSGQPLTGSPSAGGLGTLQSSAVEGSNVDLSTQLVDLIVAQQAYQANAQTIKTQNTVLQTLLSL
jgi:flagellar hook protein FlgE